MNTWTRPALGLAALACLAVAALPGPARETTSATGADDSPAAPLASDTAGTRSAGTRPTARARFDCKPQGPLAVHFEQTGSGPGDEVELAFSIEPAQPMVWLSWRLEAPAGARWIAGADHGETAGQGAAGTARLHLLAGDSTCAVILVVSGLIDAPEGTEPVEVRRTLRWGTPSKALPEQIVRDVPETLTADPSEGLGLGAGRIRTARTRFAAVPVSHGTER